MLFRSICNHTIFKNNIRFPKGINTGRILVLPALVAVLAFLTACASAPGPQLSASSLNETREYTTPNDGVFAPWAAGEAIPDADILSLDKNVTAMLDKTVMPISNPYARLDAIIKILNKKVRWDTESDRYATQTAMETYRTGTGNCLSFANLFIAMARYAGIDAGYQEVSTGLNWNREGGVLFTSKHISATTTINDIFNSDVELVFTDNNEVMIQATSSDDTLPRVSGSLAIFQQQEVQTQPIPDCRAFAQYYNNIASMYLAEGNPDLAFKYFFKSIETDSTLPFIWSNLGVAYSRNHQWASAEAAYFKALSIARDTDDTSVQSIFNNMVKLYERSGNEEKADFYRAEVAAFRDKNPYYHYLEGQSAFSEASYEKSVKYFKAAIKRKNDDDLFYYSLAMAYLKLGEIQKAEKNIGKAKYYAWNDQKREYYGQVLQTISEIVVY